jgi:hypothetical protein
MSSAIGCGRVNGIYKETASEDSWPGGQDLSHAAGIATARFGGANRSHASFAQGLTEAVSAVFDSFFAGCAGR